MGLSSNILWHQTKKDAFFKILRSKEFLYSYCIEKVFPINEEQGLAIPMISMSDFPFSEIANNKWAYGDYAIGLSREWGIRNRFSPVLYCNRGSHIYRHLTELMDEAIKNGNMDSFFNCVSLFSYMKFVQDTLETRYKKYSNYRFYDEREHRLVLDWRKETNASLYLSDAEYSDYKKERSSSTLDFGVKFTWEDVKYLIVNSNSNVTEVNNLLKKENVTRPIYIFTKAQVLEDFVGIEHHKEIQLPTSNLAYHDMEVFGNLLPSTRQVKQVEEDLKENLNRQREER